eukprot:gene19381-biopygen20006
MCSRSWPGGCWRVGALQKPARPMQKSRAGDLGQRVGATVGGLPLIGKREAYKRGDRLERSWNHLGLGWSMRKGGWKLVPLIKHLGLEVNSQQDNFRMTAKTLPAIYSEAKELICEAPREQRWLPVHSLAAFNGRRQPMHLAVHACRLYLLELYFAQASKRCLRWNIKLTRQGEWLTDARLGIRSVKHKENAVSLGWRLFWGKSG